MRRDGGGGSRTASRQERTTGSLLHERRGHYECLSEGHAHVIVRCASLNDPRFSIYDRGLYSKPHQNMVMDR